MFLFLMYQSPIADTEAYLLLTGLRAWIVRLRNPADLMNECRNKLRGFKWQVSARSLLWFEGLPANK